MTVKNNKPAKKKPAKKKVAKKSSKSNGRDSTGKFAPGNVTKGSGRKPGTAKTGGRKKGVKDKAVEIREQVEAIAGSEYAINESFQKALNEPKTVEEFNSMYQRAYAEGSPLDLLAFQTVARAMKKEAAATNFILRSVTGDPLENRYRAETKEKLDKILPEIMDKLESGVFTISDLQAWELRHRSGFVGNAYSEQAFNDIIASLQKWSQVQVQQQRLENEAMFRERSLILAQRANMTKKQQNDWIALIYEVLERYAAKPEEAFEYYNAKVSDIVPELVGPANPEEFRQLLEGSVDADFDEEGFEEE